MVKLNPEREATNRLVSFVRSVAMKRAIEAANPGPTANYWLVIRSGLFDQAVVEWCVMFGNHNQPLHWKQRFDENAFRDGLMKTTGKTRDEWDEYGAALTTYRNEIAAHVDLTPTTVKFPNMDAALAAAFYYYERLCDFGQGDPAALRREYDDNLKTFTALSEAAVAATTGTGILGG
ncbi:hypothetical protein PMI01_04495 [Caulobacter sp. AP07]|jgi:hypothetical protein|uniref:hypothetical protein n=1 Tax=Caulobacter sp. AP07 TaxID=1144304 RepID=UPI00027211B2|nr:hypothetical protein [Caulobacter sp. AP07]EJL25276.1 hypothetical protein PMI01_04495 [Caulobacter sp. AP07]